MNVKRFDGLLPPTHQGIGHVRGEWGSNRMDVFGFARIFRIRTFTSKAAIVVHVLFCRHAFRDWLARHVSQWRDCLWARHSSGCRKTIVRQS